MASKEVVKTERAEREAFDFTEPLILRDSGSPENAKTTFERIRLLWQHRGFLCRVVAVGFALTTIIALLIPSQYTSTVRLMPPDQDNGTGIGMLTGLASKAGASIGGLGAQLLALKTSGDLFVGILQSRKVADSIIAKFDLRKEYGIKHWDDTRKRLASRTIISQDRKSGILTIEVSDRSPQRAQEIAQEYVSELNLVVNSLNTSSAHRERLFLEERLSRVQQDLDSAQKDFGEFASKNTTIDIQSQGKAMLEAGAMLAGQLGVAQTELEGLRQMYTDNNVRVRALQARVNEIRKQLEKFGGRSGSEASTEQDASALYPPIRKLPLLGVTYANLYRRIKVQETVFEVLTQQYELAKVQEAKETPSIKVLDSPDIPERKSFPHRVAIIFTGTLLAAIVGAALVLATAHWEAIDPRHPGKVLASEVLATMRTYWYRGYPAGSPVPASGNRPTVVDPSDES